MNGPASDSLLASALHLATYGLCVFPLVPGTEFPFKGTRGWRGATRDAARIAAWWTAIPYSNIGIGLKASGIFILEVRHPLAHRHLDGTPGPDGFATLAALEAQHSAIPGPRAATPRGDAHLYLRAVTGLQIRRQPGPGIVVRRNGYVVAPPSTLFETSEGYGWLVGAP